MACIIKNESSCQGDETINILIADSFISLARALANDTPI